MEIFHHRYIYFAPHTESKCYAAAGDLRLWLCAEANVRRKSLGQKLISPRSRGINVINRVFCKIKQELSASDSYTFSQVCTLGMNTGAGD